jgi:hypothetical protein
VDFRFSRYLDASIQYALSRLHPSVFDFIHCSLFPRSRALALGLVGRRRGHCFLVGQRLPFGDLGIGTLWVIYLIVKNEVIVPVKHDPVISMSDSFDLTCVLHIHYLSALSRCSLPQTRIAARFGQGRPGLVGADGTSVFNPRLRR